MNVSNIANITEFGGFGQHNGDFDVTIANEKTGFNSENEAEFELEQNNDVDIDNDADIDNDVDVDATTGNNEANKNTSCFGETEIRTGDADADVDVNNFVNKVRVGSGEGNNSDIEADLRNECTGAESKNEIDFSVERNNDIDIDNDADIDNDIDVDANTGDNEANENTGDAFIETGDASVDFDVNTEANLVKLSEQEHGDIDVDALNCQTGFNSENEIKIELENNNEIDIDNDADIDNDIDVDATTGDNEASRNTGEAEIRTGDATVTGELNTRANVVGLGEENFAGDDFDVDANNSTTGACSENEVKIELENNNKVDVDNDTNLENDVDVEAKTGRNEAEENCFEGEVRTGDSDVDLTVDSRGGIINGDEDIDCFSTDHETSFDKDLFGEGGVNVIVNGDHLE